jgi:hypothetical protein
LRKRAHVLYDRANSKFKRLNIKEQHEIYKKIFSDSLSSNSDETPFTIKNEKTEKIIKKEDRAILLMSCTSFTEDEDFSILVKVLDILENQITAKELKMSAIYIVITGEY